MPDIPQGPWEDQEPSATVTAEVPPPSPMDVSMELTEPWQRETQPADEVTASVPSLGDLLSSEPDATESITTAVPGLSSLVDESREEVALTQAPEAGPVPDGADMDVTLLDGELAGCRRAGRIFAGLDLLVGAPACLHHHLVHPACNCRDLGMRPLLLTGSHCPFPGLAGGSGAQGQEEESVQPSPGLSEDGNEQGPALASKWGFNPGCEDTMDLNLELHGRMIMGDHTYGRLYGDVTGSAASLEEGEAGAEEEGGEEEEERLGEQDGGARLGEQGGLSPERNTGLSAPDRDLDAGAGRAEESDLDSIEPACSPPPEHPRSLEVSPTAEERRALGPMQDDQVPASEPVWTAPAFLPPYMMASGSQVRRTGGMQALGLGLVWKSGWGTSHSSSDVHPGLTHTLPDSHTGRRPCAGSPGPGDQPRADWEHAAVTGHAAQLPGGAAPPEHHLAQDQRGAGERGQVWRAGLCYSHREGRSCWVVPLEYERPVRTRDVVMERLWCVQDR